LPSAVGEVFEVQLLKNPIFETMKWKWQQQAEPKNKDLYRQLSLAGIIAYMLGLLAPLFPAEELVMEGQTYHMSLIGQYSGQAVWVILFLFGLLQAWGWFGKKKWWLWTGLLAGLHTSAFALMRMMHLWWQQSTDAANNLSTHAQVSTRPLFGLYLVLMAGLAIFCITLAQGWNTLARNPGND
jgi:hypothetical protein